MPRDADGRRRRARGQGGVVSGASRGIGRACALALARRGASVVVAAKSATESSDASGDGARRRARVRRGGDARRARDGVRDESAGRGVDLACVARAMARYGRVDVVVNNASALWWQDIEDTPTKKYDLIQGVNARGAFVLTRACMREMRAGGTRRTGDLDGTAAAEEL